MRLNPIKSSHVLIACLLGLAFSALLFGPALRNTWNGTDDFLGLYAAGRLAFTPDMYNPQAVMRVQRQSAGYENRKLVVCRAPFYGVLLWPLAQLPYRLALLLWTLFMIFCAVASVWLWRIPDRVRTAIACCWSVPLFAAIAIGQDLAAVLLLVCCAFRALSGGREFRAGLILSLGAVKPHLFLLLPVLIINWRLWRTAAGIAVGGAVLTALSFFGGGPDWIAAFFRNALSPEVTPAREVIPTLYGLSHGHLAVELALASLVIVATVISVRRGTLEYGFAAVLIGGILTAHHAYESDLTITIPALLLVWARSPHVWQRYLCVLLLCPIPYVAVFATGSAVLLQLLLLAAVIGLAVANPTAPGQFVRQA